MQIKNFNRPVSEAGGMLGPVEVGVAPLGCDAQPHTKTHDVPHELMRLTAKMTHHAASDLGGTARASDRASVPPLTRNLP